VISSRLRPRPSTCAFSRASRSMRFAVTMSPQSSCGARTGGADERESS
jgi:hypothetical protein